MTDFEKIDSEEKFLEVYGDKKFLHFPFDYVIERDSEGRLWVNEFPASWGNITDTLLYKYGFIDEQSFWMWREHFRFQEDRDINDVKYKRVELQGLRQILDLDTCWLDEVEGMEKLFPHTSMVRDGMIAYTPDEKKGQQDRQVRIKFGKFFRKYYQGEISDDELKYLSNEFMGKYGKLEIKWAKGGKIADVYQYYHDGFGSCMMGDDHEFDCDDHHPCEVYDSPDIQLAYFGNDDAQRVQARCLINVKDNQYSVVYGNEQLRDMLENMGYERGDLEGCRIRKISLGDQRYVMPYIDGTCDFNELDRDYFIISESGKYCAGTTGGVVYLKAQHMCDCCGDQYDEDELEEVFNDESVCEYCLDNAYVYAYVDRHRCEYVHRDLCVFSDTENEYYLEELVDELIVWVESRNDYCLEDDCVYSERQQEWIHSNDAVEVEVLKVTGTDWVHEDFDVDEEEDLRVA